MENRLFPFLQLFHSLPLGLDLFDLNFIELTRCLFAVTADEWNRGTFSQETDGAVDLSCRNAHYLGNLLTICVVCQFFFHDAANVDKIREILFLFVRSARKIALNAPKFKNNV